MHSPSAVDFDYSLPHLPKVHERNISLPSTVSFVGSPTTAKTLPTRSSWMRCWRITLDGYMKLPTAWDDTRLRVPSTESNPFSLICVAPCSVRLLPYVGGRVFDRR